MIPAAADRVPTADSFHTATPDLHQIPQGKPGFVGQAQAQQMPLQGAAQPANTALLGGIPASPQIQHVPAGNALPSDHASTFASGQHQLPMQMPQQVHNQVPSDHISTYASGQPQLPVHTPQQVPSQLPGPSSMPLADQYAPHSGQHAGQVMPADARDHSFSEPGQASAQAPSSRAALSFEDAAQTVLTDIAKVVVFDQQGTILFSSFQARSHDLNCLLC